MSFSIAEFDRRVKNICDRWYVEGGNVLRIFRDKNGKEKTVTMLRPVYVMEHPYSVGRGFVGDTKVLVVGNWKHFRQHGIWEMPSVKHLKKLAKAHWQRRRAEQLKLLQASQARAERRKADNDRQMDYDTEENLKQDRHLFAKASEGLGITRSYLEGAR